MFFRRDKEFITEFADSKVTKVTEELKKCLQTNYLMIQSLRDELHDLKRQLNLVVNEESPSKQVKTYQHRLIEYQQQLDSLAGQVFDGALPEPPERD